MSIDPSPPTLISAIEALLDRARSERAELANPSQTVAVDQMLKWPELHAVNQAAAATARVHGYLHQEGDGDTGERWGRRLNKRTVSTLGLIELLRTPTSLPDRLATDLAGYLAGPAVAITEFAVIDADLRIRGEHEVAGWGLSRLSAADLDTITPLPSTRPFGADPWDEALRAGDCCVLRRTADHLTARFPSVFPRDVMTSLFEPELVIAAWEPLLLLNLAQPDRVIVAAEYEVEPGRLVERVRGTGLGLVPQTYDGVEEFEVPAWGPCYLDEADVADVLAFTNAMSPLLARWQTPEQHELRPDRKRATEAGQRLHRSAHQFVALGPRLGAGGDVLHERERAEIIFWYVSALEHLMILKSEKGEGDFTRKVSQRTAVLIGLDDEERLEILRTVKQAYNIRSQVAHGALPSGNGLATLPGQLRAYLRRVFRNLIILGPLFDLATICDNALVSAAVREEQITGPIHQVVEPLPSGPWR
ncbi:hypothetical protein [Micromonospora marina]|uniref:hypothetical protein n=1 Tax=Micromonospora marina TaxID=307120 RepID=UPI003D7511A3